MQHISRSIGHRLPCSERGFSPSYRTHKKRSEVKTPCCVRWCGPACPLSSDCGTGSDFKGADVLLADLPDETEEVIGDRSYDSTRIRLSLAERNIIACIPPKKNRKSKPPYNWHLHKKRHLIENMFAKQKDWRRVATRYDRSTHTFMSPIHIAASFIFYLKE